MKNIKKTILFTCLAVAFTVEGSEEVAGRTVFEQGHLDIDFDYTAEAGWVLRHRHEDKGIQPFERGLLFVRDGTFPAEGSRILRLEGAEWDFLGVEAGEPIWYLPPVDTDGILWPGMAAEHTVRELLAPWEAGDPRRTATASRWIAVDLVDVRFTGQGSGHLAMWVFDSFGGPLVFWSTADPHPAGNRYLMGAGSHNHMAWGFSAPGVYEVDVQASTVLADGSVSESAVETIVFVVGASSDPARYPEWAALRFSEQARAAGEAHPAADPGGTRVANLLAFAAGFEPGVPMGTVAPQLSGREATFSRRADLGDTVFRVMGSSDLVAWTEIAHTTGGEPWVVEDEAVAIEEAAPEGNSRQVVLTLAADSPPFLRLQAEQSEP